jgi:AcrR family transcriptional regulator
MTEVFQRARRPEQKELRREAILAAARAAALESGVRAVSLADIAARAGIHKSALLRYFQTREEIFLELAQPEWREWAETTSAALDAGGDVAATLAESFAARPLLCDLIPHTALNLERNATLEAVRAYKYVSLGSVEAVSEAVGRALPELRDYECRELVSVLASGAGALWQIANPPPALAELYRSDPALGGACVELEPRLRRTGEVLLAGFVPTRDAGA